MNHWYDNEISQGILREKYYHKGETNPEQFMDRVSSIFDDDLRPRVRGYLEEASFCPAGRALYAAGSKGKFKVSLSNCYILFPLPDVPFAENDNRLPPNRPSHPVFSDYIPLRAYF